MSYLEFFAVLACLYVLQWFIRKIMRRATNYNPPRSAAIKSVVKDGQIVLDERPGNIGVIVRTKRPYGYNIEFDVAIHNQAVIDDLCEAIVTWAKERE